MFLENNLTFGNLIFVINPQNRIRNAEMGNYPSSFYPDIDSCNVFLRLYLQIVRIAFCFWDIDIQRMVFVYQCYILREDHRMALVLDEEVCLLHKAFAVDMEVGIIHFESDFKVFVILFWDRVWA